MPKKTSLVLLLLLPCVCRAGEYEDAFRALIVEQTGHRNYNSRFVFIGFANMHIEKGYYYSFDWMYFRIIEDENTWRFSSPIVPYFASFMGMFAGGGPRSDRPISLFDPAWEWGAVIPTLPLMLMNPTVGIVTKPWNIGVGYNTDFIFTSSDMQIYFAPKIQLGWIVAEAFSLSMALSYQVADCFATKRGFHLGLSVASMVLTNAENRPLEVYNRSEYGITARLVSKTTGEEIKRGYHNYVSSHTRQPFYNEDSWETVINKENGLIMQAFPMEYRNSPSDSLDKMTPLKEWDIPDWESVKNVKGDYYYP